MRISDWSSDVCSSDLGLAGDFDGLVAGGKHPFGAEAVDRVVLCQLPIQLLRELVSRFPEMEHRLLDMRDVALVAAQDRMVLLSRKNPTEKIATFLLEISASQERLGWPAGPGTLSMPRGDIGDSTTIPVWPGDHQIMGPTVT